MHSAASVFIADDNPAILQGLTRALSANGYRVSSATSGRDLLDLLRGAGAAPDLLLLDVMMPEASGLDVLRVVRGDARWTDLPVVLITATSDATLPAVALRDGAVDFLNKPFRLDELLARVDSHVRRGRALRRARDQARMRLRAIDLIRELNRVVTADEMFRLVTSRTAEILGICRCSVAVMDRPGGRVRLAASSVGAEPAGEPLDLELYPEVREALASGETVSVPDVSSSPLFEPARERWERQGLPRVRSAIATPFRITDALTGVLLERAEEGEPPLGEDAAELAGRVVEAIIQACGRVQVFQSLIEQRSRLHDLAHTDELTGCASRRAVLQALEEQLALARNRSEPMSLVILDIDQFKEINDGNGHLAGDAVLRALGGWLRAEGALRAPDVAGRYGGDEFLVVLPQTPSSGALRFADRARRHLADNPVIVDGRPLAVTLSAGVAASADGEAVSGEALIARADAALYRAKQAGRNRVHLSEPIGNRSSVV